MVSFDGGSWRYSFRSCGREYSGECAGCETAVEAERYEEELRLDIGRVARCGTLGALYSERVEELLGREGIPLEDAVERFLSVPRSRVPGAARVASLRLWWGRLVDWLRSERPGIRHVQEIGVKDAEAYVSLLRGRFSGHTANMMHSALGEVFGALNVSMRLPDNPFRMVPLLRGVRHEGHSAFTGEELALMLSSVPPLLEPLVVVGLGTGMRLGDVCTLRERDVVRRGGRLFLSRRQRKTGGEVSVPAGPEESSLVERALGALQERRRSLESDGSAARGEDEGYLFPELAAQFLKNRQTVSQWVTRWLRRLGLSTSERAEGFTRRMNRKGMHSFRHTYCTIAGEAGVPRSVVQSMAGQLTGRMADLYSRHVSDAAKEEGVALYEAALERTVARARGPAAS